MLATAPRVDLLTAAGIELLNADRSPWMRAQTAAAVAVLFVEGTLSAREKHFALSIMELLARDLEQQVRAALSEHVKHCVLLPRSIAYTLAMDVESVAVPILRYSSVLDEADFLAIARGGGQAKQIAVARRDNLAATVSDALVETRNQEVVSALLANHTAQIGETSYGKILDIFDQNERVKALMVERPALPAAIIARMVLRVSDVLCERLIERFKLPEAMAGELTARARERALASSIGPDCTAETMDTMSHRLLEEGALTPIFLLRALCTGQLRLFTAAVAARAGVSFDNAHELINDGGRQGMMSLYIHAGLPGDLMNAYRIALDVVLEVADTRSGPWSESYTRQIVAQLVAVYDDLAPGHLEAVLAQLSRHCHEDRARPSGGRPAALTAALTTIRPLAPN